MRSSLSVLALCAVFASCQKETPSTPQPAAVVDGSPKIYSRTFHNDFGVPSCTSPPHNCIHEIVIHPKFTASVTNVFTVVARANDAEIRAQFTASRADLINYMSVAHVDGVIAGTLLARTPAQPDVNGNRYMIVHKAAPGNAIELVYPMDL
jgi:hypothetical protein